MNRFSNSVYLRVRVLSKREMVDNQQTLMEWIAIYTDEYVTGMDHKSDNTLKSFPFDDDLQMNNLIPAGEVKQYGIWYEVDGKLLFLFSC